MTHDAEEESFEELLANARQLLSCSEGVGELWEANTKINLALAQRPDDGPAWLLKSQILSALEDDPAALACADRASAFLPPARASEGLYVRATVYGDLGAWDAALEDLEEAMEGADDDAWLVEDILYEQAMVLHALGRGEEAMARLREGLSRFPASELLRSGVEPLQRERLRHRLRVIDGGR